MTKFITYKFVLIPDPRQSLSFYLLLWFYYYAYPIIIRSVSSTKNT